MRKWRCKKMKEIASNHMAGKWGTWNSIQGLTPRSVLLEKLRVYRRNDGC